MEDHLDRRLSLTPDSPERAMVREHMPLQASQKRISWSYEPVTSMTDMSCRAVAGATGWFGMAE